MVGIANVVSNTRFTVPLNVSLMDMLKTRQAKLEIRLKMNPGEYLVIFSFQVFHFAYYNKPSFF